MSLRDSLRGTVARCTPQGMQHATTTPANATADATTVQLPSCVGPQSTPKTEALPLPALHELHRPATYEGPQEKQGAQAKVARCTHRGLQHATTAPVDATTSATTVQLPSCTALGKALAAAINRACDVRGDDAVNRAGLLAECAALPTEGQADMLAHFTLEAVRR